MHTSKRPKAVTAAQIIEVLQSCSPEWDIQQIHVPLADPSQVHVVYHTGTEMIRRETSLATKAVREICLHKGEMGRVEFLTLERKQG